MHWSLASRSRLRTVMNRYGASSLSHSTRTGNPRISLLATSASSCEYAASTACSGVSDAGRSVSVTLSDIVFSHLFDGRGRQRRKRQPRRLRRGRAGGSHLDLDRQRPALGVLADFFHGAHLLGLLLEGVAGHLVHDLRNLRLQFLEVL